MKITFLVPMYWPSKGGVQMVTQLHGRYLVRQGHEVSVLTSQMKDLSEGDPKNPRRIAHFPETETHEGVRIHRFPSGGLIDFALGGLFVTAYHLGLPSSWLFERHWLRRLRSKLVQAYLRSNPPQVLVVAPCTDWLLKTGLEASRATGCKLVVKTCLHLASPALGLRQVKGLGACDAVLSNTAYESDYLRKIGIGNDKLHEIADPVDLEALSSVAPATNDPRILALEGKKFVFYIGRKEKSKGVGHLVKLFENPSEGLQDVTLVLAGGSTDYFESEIRPRLKKNGPVLVLSSVDEATKMWLLKHCTVYSMVSSVDSFGITYLEAWMSGAPVIAADLPAMRCVVRDGVDGLLIPYGDEDRLRKALIRIISDPAGAKRMADAGRQKVLEDFSDYANERKMERVLTSVLNAPAAQQSAH